MLPFKGMGDSYLLSVINVMEKLPYFDCLDLQSNRLTDISLIPLATKLPSLPNLTYLNLSGNDIDDASEYLMDYIAYEACSLKTLLLDHADIDDIECANLATAMISNKSITALSLCNNKIGEMELLNVVMPDLTTVCNFNAKIFIFYHLLSSLALFIRVFYHL